MALGGSGPSKTFILIHIISSLFAVTFTYNLDPRIPIIKQSKKGTYFGYSVSQHQILGSGREPENVILVGAPKDDTNQPGTNKTGAVYKCGFSTNQRDCRQLSIESDNKPPPSNVLKDDQWLGVTVESQGAGGYVMACAHRFVAKGKDFRWGLGICYSLHQNLTNFMTWNPCKSQPKYRAHQQYGFCQAGTSGALTKDNEIIMGSPGPFTWRGTVFKNSVSFGLTDDKTWYMGPLSDEESPVDKYSYLGMSVTTGKFFSNIPTSYVAGAPRANGTGKVVFFSKHPDGSANFAIDLILSGDKFASSYGYSIASADLNKDSYRDLIVGAPFHYGRNTGGAIYIYMNSRKGLTRATTPVIILGKPESRFGFAIEETGDLNKDGYTDIAVGAPYEGLGTVYIYSGSEDGPSTKPSQIIRATDLPGRAMRTFGYSLSGGLDLDQNGYPDLVVGAYEADKIAVLRTRPVIKVKTEVKGQYKNINPYKSGCSSDEETKKTCFHIRPCFTLKSPELTTKRGSFIYLESYIEAETFSGKKFSRVSFGSSENSKQPNILQKVIKVDSRDINIEKCYDQTVYVKDKSDILNPIEFKLSFSLRQVEPKAPTNNGILHNVNNYPILDQSEASRIFSATFYKQCGNDDICNSDLRLESNLRLPVIRDNMYNLILGNGTFTLDITVENRNESAYDAKLFISHPVNVKMKHYISEDNSIQCPSNGTKVTCDLGNPMPENSKISISLVFDPVGVSDSENVLPFQISVNTSSVNRELEPQNMEARIIRKAEIKLAGQSEPREVYYGGEIKGASAMESEDEIGPMVTHTYELVNSGPLRISKFVVYIDWPYEVASDREHGKYALYMMRKPEVGGNGECEIDPKYVNPENITEKPSTPSRYTLVNTEPFTEPTEDITTRSPPPKKKKKKQQQSLGYDDKDETDIPKKRKKRELVVLPEDVEVKGKTYKVVKMNCKDKTAKCVRFNCTIYNLQPSRQGLLIRIKARLWDSTFTEDYANVNWVEIASNGTIVIDEKLDITQDPSDDAYEIATKVTPDLLKFPDRQKKSVPIWIIIVSVLAGMFLLAIVILLLIKFGFFKRKKPGYILAETNEKPMNDY